MSNPEFNPADEAPIDREEWESAMGLHDLAVPLIGERLVPEARDAAIEYINLYCEAAELEDHNCTDEDFARCEVCDQTQKINQRINAIQDCWAKDWAMQIAKQKQPPESTK